MVVWPKALVSGPGPMTVDLVQTTSFSVVEPAVSGCSGRVRVASEEAWDQRNQTQNILDMAEVETLYCSTTGGVVEHGHISPLHDAASTHHAPRSTGSNELKNVLLCHHDGG